MVQRARLVSVVAAGGIALAAAPRASLAQDEPAPPPPPPATRAPASGIERVDLSDPGFRGALLGDLSEGLDDPATGERVVAAVGGVSQPVWLKTDVFELRCDGAVFWGDRARMESSLRKRGAQEQDGDLLGNVIHAVYAEGSVFVRKDAYTFRADRVLLDFQKDAAYLVNALLEGHTTHGGRGGKAGHEVSLSVRADVIRGLSRDQFRAEDATLSTCTWARPHLAFRTAWVTVDFSKAEPVYETSWWPTVRADTVAGRDVPLVPVPKLGGGSGNQPFQTVELSTSSRLGTTLGLGLGGRIQREDGTTWGTWQVTPRWRSRRGGGLGVSFDHEGVARPGGGIPDSLSFEGEYQRDTEKDDGFSDRPFDGELGGRSDPDRGRFAFSYRHVFDGDAETDLLGRGWRLGAYAGWHSDRGYVPEYDSDSAVRGDQEETYVQLRRARGNQAVSILGSYRLSDETAALVRTPFDLFSTDYANATQYLPSATWHLVAEPVVSTGFAPVLLSVEAGAARVERRHDDLLARVLRTGGWSGRTVLREDVEGRVTVPFSIGPVRLTPAAGGSIYHVSERNSIAGVFTAAGPDPSHDDAGRSSAFAGLRAGVEAHRDFDVRSDALRLDGLRHVASLDAHWFDRFHVTEDDHGPFQQNDLHDQLTTENVVSVRLRNRLQTHRDGEVADWFDYEARFLWYADERRAGAFQLLGSREEFPSPLDRLDFPDEEKYLALRREGSAFHQHRAKLALLPDVWLVGEADYDMTLSAMETTAAGVRLFPGDRLSVYLGRRAIDDDSTIWTLRADYRLSDRWAFTGEFQEDTERNRGLRTRVGLHRRGHDLTFAVEFESERLLEETSFAFLVYPHDWLVQKSDPFSRRRPLDFEALRWYR